MPEHHAKDADVLMEHLPPIGWADVATRQDLAGTRDSLQAEIAHLGTTLRLEMQSVESRLEARISRESRTVLLAVMAMNIATFGAFTALAR